MLIDIIEWCLMHDVQCMMPTVGSGGAGGVPLSSLPPAAVSYITVLNNSDVAAEYVTKLKVGCWSEDIGAVTL